MIRVPLYDVPLDVRHPYRDARPDEVRFVRDAFGVWWVKVAASPEGWFCLSAESDFEASVEGWLSDMVEIVRGAR